MIENILTAIDIDNNIKTISKKLDEDVELFSQVLLKKKIKHSLDEQKLLLSENPDLEVKTKEELKAIISEEIKTKGEVISYRNNHEKELKIKAQNYSVMRQTLNGLNELTEFSAEIERLNIQNIDNYLDWKDLNNQIFNLADKLKKLLVIRKENINAFVSTFKDEKIIYDENIVIQKMKELYSINKEYDSTELYLNYSMDTNIDFSNRLGEIYLKNFSNGNFSDNVVNLQLENLGNKKIIIDNKFLGTLLISGMSASNNEQSNSRLSFVSNNAVTCYKNMWVTSSNNIMTYCTRTLGELLIAITDNKREHVDKENREQIYITYDGTRPHVDEYQKWNGLQVFDLDLKEYTGNIDYLKVKLFEVLREYHWFLWICKSSSGKGLHIYTKVTPAHHVYVKIKDNELISKYWYKINFIHKSGLIYAILYDLHNDPNIPITFNELEDNFDVKDFDKVVQRITTGIRLTYDKDIMVNSDFLDLHVSVGLTQTKFGWLNKDEISRIWFRQTDFNTKLQFEIFEIVEALTNNKNEVEKEEKSKKTITTLNVDFDELKALPRSKINYVVRFNVCNTLANLYGKDGLNLAHTILDSKGCDNIREINGMYACALSNKKETSKIGLDILRKAGIIKIIEPELKQEAQNNFKSYIKKLIENTCHQIEIEDCIELADNQYISDIKEQLLNDKTGIVNNKINLIFSPPNTGKTEFIKQLAREGKRIMLILPYISVIKNKIETDAEISKLFKSYYGSEDIKKIDYGVNVVTTFDKFAKSSYDKISKIFDYIFIDESHLLFTSQYRIQATSQAIKKITELFFISINDPFAAKLCLLTGTETGETYFFGQVANVIRIKKKSLEKTMEFHICDDMTDCTTRLANKVASLIIEKYRIIIPTNKGDIYSEKLIGMITHLLSRKPKYAYYKRSNNEQEICDIINDTNSIGDYEIVFCSNYLSVGVDILDRYKFASIYFGPFSGYEIEQFNARIRKTGIRSLYCIATENANGYINEDLLEEPNMVLRLTNDDINNFKDDKEIASAKQEFIAQYDPVLRQINTPGFSLLSGKIMFNKEEYELTMFENKYNECMQHPVRVARELSKYGYNITVSTQFEGLSILQQQELKSIGLSSAREEKIRKHKLLVGTFMDLVSNNTHINKNGLEYTNIIGWIGKNPDKIFEVRSQEEYIKYEFDIFASPINIYVRSREALDHIYSQAKYLISKYSVSKCIEILNRYIDEAGIIKIKAFKRSINLLKLIESNDSNELTMPMSNMIEKIYEFVDKFEISKDYKISYNHFTATIDEWTHSYIDMIGININTVYGYEKIKDGIIEMLMDISTKQTTKTGIRFSYNKLPEQDSASVINRRSVDIMIQNMFHLTTEAIKSNKSKKMNEKHIIFERQEF